MTELQQGIIFDRHESSMEEAYLGEWINGYGDRFLIKRRLLGWYFAKYDFSSAGKPERGSTTVFLSREQIKISGYTFERTADSRLRLVIPPMQGDQSVLFSAIRLDDSGRCFERV